jgi:nicotinamidase-related amidase
MGRKILVVVDYQYDFFSPDGALYVNGGEKLQEKIANIIPNFDGVIFTQDCHPYNHCSFIDMGGEWPRHCVEDSIGAGIPIEFFNAAKHYAVEKKGMDYTQEEYGAFSDKISLCSLVGAITHPDDLYYNKFVFNDDEYEFVICGIAGNYCVLETLKNIVKHVGNNKVSVFLDGVVSIDDGTTLNTYMKENNIKIY